MLASHLAFCGIDPCCYPSPLQRVELSLKTSMPWLILAGSGGVADLLSEVLERVSPAPPSTSPPAEGEGGATPSVDMRERVAEIVRSHFPGHGDLDKLVEQVTTSSTTSSFTYLLNGRIPTESQVTPKQSAAPLRLWNSLPPQLRNIDSFPRIKTQLKTHLFKTAYST